MSTRRTSLAPRGLHSLSELKTALDEARREAERQQALEREIAAREKRERELFAITVGPVQPLRPTGRARQARALPSPEPRQRQRDEREALRESLSDEFNVDTLLETDETLSFRRPEIGLDVVRKLRRGGWAIQGQIDLHGLRRDPARVKLNAFIRDAAEQGLRCVRVVHGKGLGSPGREPVLKARVRSWLVQKNEVLAFVQARPAEGGSGALVVLLKAA
ncbi:Smr/MutS family protein [Piscinibacter sp. HJYY11]|uniref:Smr/MutS family protein n=1 Tax=Piscinibacter sp. HJYY11 TaxID=2801333 RepID=UPI00191D2B4A|nr:Smr/MutS family protein [Piscinibacter sp. HJYY11]MBL0727789.1 Smr/MutS family protein [Piscinibacter sp. HJYY11]